MSQIFDHDRYISIPTWTHSDNSIGVADLSKWSRRPSQSTRESSQAMRWNGATPNEFDGKSIETETTTWLEFSNRGKAIVEQTFEQIASEKRKKPKRAGKPWQGCESHSQGFE